jgi:hypothetical protein
MAYKKLSGTMMELMLLIGRKNGRKAVRNVADL